MGRANVLTLTCPHCARQLRVGIEHAGWRTRCPHPDCRRPLTIPLDLDHDDEPDEAVLIAEGPPVPVPVLARRGPRDEADGAPPPGRGPGLLWALAALLVGATVAAAVGWTLLKFWRARAAGPEASAGDSRPADTDAPPAVMPDPPVAPAPPVPDVPVPEPVAPPKREKVPVRREAFVGRWAAVDPPQPNMIEVTVEFRADGSSELTIDTPAGQPQRFAGAWRWEGDRLFLSFAGVDGARPSAVTWNGPDEFVATNDGRPATYRRKRP